MMLAIWVALFVVAVGIIDFIYLKKEARRALVFELIGFGIVLVFAWNPTWFTEAANEVGIGRGVDLLIYPTIIWLFREAVLSRVRYLRHKREITRLTREIAFLTSTRVGGSKS